MSNYTAPPKTRIGHIQLKASDTDRTLSFYRDLLGFEVTTMYGEFFLRVIIITIYGRIPGIAEVVPHSKIKHRLISRGYPLYF